MGRRTYLCLIAILQILSYWDITVRSRHFASPDEMASLHQQDNIPAKASNKGVERMEEPKSYKNEEALINRLSRLGSRPPNCEHKCSGCVPCYAIQTPATTDRVRMGLHYANYEPEGWKCKCGASFYDP